VVEINNNCLKGLLTFQMEQIDAHIGGVNDIAFSHPNKSLSIITCGDDKLIKVRVLI
jgi:WD40 repeat protein